MPRPDFQALNAKLNRVIGPTGGHIPAETFTQLADKTEAELERHLRWAERMRAVDPQAALMNAKGPEEIASTRRLIARWREMAAQPQKAA